jgi:hypothetical protein
MKKLLALVLCVMMFVSVLSTNAFADKATVSAHPDFDTGLLTDTPRAAANNKAIKNAKENIEYMYGALAADNAVFGTIKSMDSVIGSIASDLFSGVDEFRGIPGGKLKDNTKTVLRDYIGSSIVSYLEDHSDKFETASQSWKTTLSDGTTGSLTYTGKFTNRYGDPIYVDKEGSIYALGHDGTWYVAVSSAGTRATASTTDTPNVTDADIDDLARVKWQKLDKGTVRLTREYKYDPIAYANTFAAAVNDAFNSKDGASLIQSMVYQLYSAKVYDDLEDKFDDLWDEMADWEDGSAILSQYHFHDLLPNGYADQCDVFSPYALMDLDNYPNKMALPAAILVP